MRAIPLLAVILLASSGCLQLFGDDETEPSPLSETEFAIPDGVTAHDALAADDITWPDFSGQTLQILDHGAFAAFDTAAARFKEMTGAEVEHTAASDTGTALRRAIQDRDEPQYDILYGIDNIVLGKALQGSDGAISDDPQDWLFQAYTPQLAARVPDELVFFGAERFTAWPATPVDHGYIAPNVDHRHESLDNITLRTLFDLRANADKFVTQDPRFSTPGLGFLLVTIDRFGDNPFYSWQDYWRDLFADDLLVTSDWSAAYEIHFSGGYGWDMEGHVGDRAVVTSYTESPAYEWYWDEIVPNRTGEYDPGYHYDSDPDNLPKVLLDPAGSAFHQIQTMAILAGTKNRALAEAWIEFTLTDDFQALAAPENAVYPVVPAVDADEVFSDVDPEPGTFTTANMSWDVIARDLDDWIDEWVDLCETADCA